MGKKIKGATIGAAVGVGVALIGIPMSISVLGFTASGIAAGSVAAKMMSVAAIANNGGVAAGSTVAVLQSIGAAGFSFGTKIGLTSVLGPLGAAAGAKLANGKKTPGDKPK
ncbi:interferon alpha-inducible protein 27, mitochondrial-like [Phalacrocorax aristotelis]|uniref:interferon alpha-inducible protein 27, mitochondrial-like n=1 Tax=Phalacrocorax aristotelis TaxID=126867 RepID=UPI003F4B6D11